MTFLAKRIFSVFYSTFSATPNPAPPAALYPPLSTPPSLEREVLRLVPLSSRPFPRVHQSFHWICRFCEPCEFGEFGEFGKFRRIQCLRFIKSFKSVKSFQSIAFIEPIESFRSLKFHKSLTSIEFHQRNLQCRLPSELRSTRHCRERAGHCRRHLQRRELPAFTRRDGALLALPRFLRVLPAGTCLSPSFHGFHFSPRRRPRCACRACRSTPISSPFPI